MSGNMILFILIGYLQIGISDQGISQCRSGWLRHDNSCYLFVHQNETWSDALTGCKIFGAHLAEITSSRENNFLQNKLTELAVHTYGYWIGASDLEIEGEWKWVSSNTPMTFSDWISDEPNGYTAENCLEMWKMGFHWNDEHCHKLDNYICEQELQELPSVIG